MAIDSALWRLRIGEAGGVEQIAAALDRFLGGGKDGAISDGHSAVQRNHFIPVFLSYSVDVSLE